jgi:hypothetical protein
MKKPLLALVLGALVMLGPTMLAASLQPVGAAPLVVADADDARYAGLHDVQGVVTYFKHRKLHLRVHGQIFFARLHKGTVIVPTGLTLIPGLVVHVQGFSQKGVFWASRIVLVH